MEGGCPRRSSEIFSLARAPGPLWAQGQSVGAASGGCHPGGRGEDGSAGLSAPHAGGQSSPPGTHPCSRASPTLSSLDPTVCGDIRGCYQLQKWGSEVEGFSAHQAQPLTGARCDGSPLRQSHPEAGQTARPQLSGLRAGSRGQRLRHRPLSALLVTLRMALRDSQIKSYFPESPSSA